MKEGSALSNPDTTYYYELEDRLELVLTFTEQGVQPFLSGYLLTNTLKQMSVSKHSRLLSSKISSKHKLSTHARIYSPGSSRVPPVSLQGWSPKRERHSSSSVLSTTFCAAYPRWDQIPFFVAVSLHSSVAYFRSASAAA